ncbi:hypothetical protein HHK36_014792 [Tetracentron sinense]|uniref:Proliferating cell nuclear antigen PCNA C-terminal domain-containing protein n=1 Tax=Tetracentron sinense TaxID=13715 RepID=A0A835DFJ6_TETSI|nr:hypothetical protein HHK36_014792 [Tetracentron sinense]
MTKEGVKFSTKNDIGSANIVFRQNSTVDKMAISLLGVAYFMIFVWDITTKNVYL